jgi:hypothetical protein
MSKNDVIRLTGIIFCLFAVQGFIRAVVSMFLGKSLDFSFGSIPGSIALPLYILLLVSGIILVSKTKPFDNEKK